MTAPVTAPVTSPVTARAVHQFVTTYEPGAVGGHVAQVRAALRAEGIESEVFADHIDGDVDGRAYHLADYGRAVPARPTDVLLYQMAIGSTMADWVVAQPQPLVVNYHNITPAPFFAGWEPLLSYDLAWGRLQLADLARRASLGIADSAYNAAELDEMGFARSEVAPILLDLDAFDSAADPATLDRLTAEREAGGSSWLFVGRLAPNKAPHDLVRAFAVYRAAFDPHARLRLVGASSSQAYHDALIDAIGRLGLGAAVELTGSVPPAVLAAHYRAADVFVCLSDHEGFCVPLLEAWWHDVPVVAFAAAAVPETLGDGGVLLTDKTAARVAAAVDRVVRDEALRAGLMAAGQRRLASFSLERTRARFLHALAPVLGGTPTVGEEP